MRNSDATPHERTKIQNFIYSSVKMKEDSAKVLQFFGQARGAGRSCKAIIQDLCKVMAVGEGHVISPDNVLWSFCKHLWISQLKALPAPPVYMKNGPSIECFCLPKTAFMPLGCCDVDDHTRAPLWKLEHPFHHLKIPCSTCLRCDR